MLCGDERHYLQNPKNVITCLSNEQATQKQYKTYVHPNDQGRGKFTTKFYINPINIGSRTVDNNAQQQTTQAHIDISIAS